MALVKKQGGGVAQHVPMFEFHYPSPARKTVQRNTTLQYTFPFQEISFWQDKLLRAQQTTGLLWIALATNLGSRPLTESDTVREVHIKIP